MIHTSDSIQAEAAQKIQDAVNKARNLKAQQDYYQNVAQNKVTETMMAARYSAVRDSSIYAEACR